MIELKYNLVNDDFITFNLHFAKSSRTYRSGLHKTRIIGSGITAAALFAIAYWWLGSWTVASLAALIGAVVAWLMLPREYWKQVEKSIRKMIYDEGAGEPGYYRLSVDEFGLREEVNGNSTSTGHASILRIEETDDHIFVFIAPARAHIIPKREVGDRLPEFLEELRQAGS